nr:hypothetical protein [Tanacetum cinerariifolium]
MMDEYNALIKNDGSLSRYIARLMANRRSQIEKIDCDETFRPVVKPATIHTLLSLALSRDWPVHQLDAKNALLHGSISKTSKYASKVLERARIVHCNPFWTIVDTESNLALDVQQICLFMHDPSKPHFAALKRILRYIRGTLDYRLHLYASSTSQITTYFDADWASCPSTRCSTSGAEAEYHGVANAVVKTAWL